MSLAFWAFWGAAGTLGFTYAGFPLLLLARAVLARRPHREEDVTPAVSVLIAAHDEAGSIGAKVANVLALDYPPERLEVVVASDGSTDGTEDVARAAGDERVRVLALPRQGKAAALNAAIAASRGDVLVFSDANSMLAPNALRALVRPLADPAVGGVAGDQRYLPAGAAHPPTDRAAEGERSYWSFDRLIKVAESRAGNVISATGALYAVRRELVQPVATGVTDDFYTSTGVIEQGRRLVFAPDAVAWEPVAASSGREFGRKVRVITRGLEAVRARRRLLDPRRHGFYALQLAWHKVLRRLMAFPLLVVAGAAPLLWRRGRLYRLATLGQAGFYAAGLTGLALPHRCAGRGPVRRALGLPAYFCLVNAACLRAVWNVVRGRRIDRWEPRREAPPA